MSCVVRYLSVLEVGRPRWCGRGCGRRPREVSKMGALGAPEPATPGARGTAAVGVGARHRGRHCTTTGALERKSRSVGRSAGEGALPGGCGAGKGALRQYRVLHRVGRPRVVVEKAVPVR